jgi:hypothetical protein
MMLFALCINPLIHHLEQQLRDIRFNWLRRKTAIVTYEDDGTIFVTEPEEITAFGEALRSYEKATGAMLNIGKPQALAVGTWNTTTSVLDIRVPYSVKIKILGLGMANRTAQPAMSSWSRITNMV